MPRRQDDDVSWPAHDTGRGIDPFDDQGRPARPPTSRPAVPPPSRSAPARGSSPARRPPAQRARSGRLVDLRTVLLAGGGLLAVVATLLVFLTDDPDLLRVAVVAAAWAFVLATFVAGRRGGEQSDAAGREAALRRTYEQELEREVAARREYELQLENDLRREAEEAMRSELDALRGELSGVTELRQEVARLAELRKTVAGLPALREDVAGLAALRADVAGLAGLRDDVAGLAALREEVARVADLREDVLSLTALRTELGQLGELRADLGRLRTELVEQLSSEMLIERIVMRTQAGRLPTGEAGRIDAGPSWRDDPPRELTGGWPAVRLEEHPGTQQYERVRVERPAPPRAWEPVTGDLSTLAPPPQPAAGPSTSPQPVASAQPQPTSAWQVPPIPAEPAAGSPPARARWQEPEPPAWSAPARPATPPSAPVTEAYGMSLPPRGSRHAAEAAGLPAEPAEPAPTPVEWLASRSLLDASGALDADGGRPAPRRRRTWTTCSRPSGPRLLRPEAPAGPSPRLPCRASSTTGPGTTGWRRSWPRAASAPPPAGAVAAATARTTGRRTTSSRGFCGAAEEGPAACAPAPGPVRHGPVREPRHSAAALRPPRSRPTLAREGTPA